MTTVLFSNFIFNTGYGLNLLALTVRDILWLRTILISAQLALMTSGFLTNKLDLAIWNIVFLTINIVQVIRIIKERKYIVLSPDLEEIFQSTFVGMDRSEFLYFWNMGQIHEIENKKIITEGTKQEDISLLISGKVNIIKKRKKISELNKGEFVGEMSFLTGKRASADVKANGAVKYISWNQNKLKSLETLNSKILTKIHSILGKDLAGKVHKATPV